MSYEVFSRKVSRGGNKNLKFIEEASVSRKHFASVGVVTKLIDSLWIEVKLIPSNGSRNYDMKKGYKAKYNKNLIVKAIKPQDMILEVGNLILITFTDLDSRQAIADYIKGKSITKEYLIDNTGVHEVDFGIVTTKII